MKQKLVFYKPVFLKRVAASCMMPQTALAKAMLGTEPVRCFCISFTDLFDECLRIRSLHTHRQDQNKIY
jgi:hypothetical protein